MRTLILPFALFLAQSVEARPAKIKSKVTTEGVGYIVRQRGEEAQVNGAAFYNDATANFYRRGKRAAELASDCLATDVYPQDGRMMVSLDCAKKPEPPREGDVIERQN